MDLNTTATHHTRWLTLLTLTLLAVVIGTATAQHHEWRDSTLKPEWVPYNVGAN